ncbi:MAG: nucleotidyltransferase family protein [Desulfomonilaceae bacterium]|nr:nucleotidyltransferase family protein [Desulfomonilaceae bacterium]
MWTDGHVEVARAHLLGPWLYHELLNSHRSGVSDGMLSVLRRDYLHSSLASMERDARLKRLLASFDARGIRVVLLKGAYLGRIVYRNPALRPMDDVDILVAEDKFEEAKNVPASLGYVLQVDALDPMHRELHPALAYVHKSRPRDAVDLHRGLWFMDYYRLSSSVVHQESSETELEGRRVSYLSPELNFIHVALHNLTHSGGLRDWLDLVLLVTRLSIDWDRLLALGQTLDVLRPLHWVLKELSRHWGVAVPPHVRQAVAEYEPHWLEDLVIRHRLRYLWRFASRFRYIDDRRDKLAYLRVSLFPSAAYRNAVVGTTAWVPYLRAKFRLFVHLGRC